MMAGVSCYFWRVNSARRTETSLEAPVARKLRMCVSQQPTVCHSSTGINSGEVPENIWIKRAPRGVDGRCQPFGSPRASEVDRKRSGEGSPQFFIDSGQVGNRLASIDRSRSSSKHPSTSRSKRLFLDTNKYRLFNIGWIKNHFPSYTINP